jgi:peptidoglycan/LPS O-acetylase OafA/YrhL
MELQDIVPRRLARRGRGAPPPIEVRLATQHTILDRMRSAGPATTGFDYLRIGLATAVLAWHSIVLSTGSKPLDRALWSGPFRFLPAAILPMFFALSGFLVSASLERARLHHFLTLRVLRIVPALAVVVSFPPSSSVPSS